MSPFEYVIVLVSIILGLGITTILTGLAELIKHKRFRWYTPYNTWLLLVFVLHIHEWWVSYSLKSVQAWHLPMFLFIILYPINLYVLAHLLFPSDPKEEFNPKEFYFSNYPKFFICAIIALVLSIIHNLTIEPFEMHDMLGMIGRIIQSSVAILLLVLLLTKNKSNLVHMLVAVFLITVVLVSLIVTQDSLTIGN